MKTLIETIFRIMVLPFVLIMVIAAMGLATVAALITVTIKLFTKREVIKNTEDELSERRDSVH
mgnify:FL=1|jgi:hypothetical protein